MWKDLGEIVKTINFSWMTVGDFKAMLSEDDKQGWSRKMRGSYPLFQQFCGEYRLKGFKGLKFTWNKGRVFEHLDRALCNSQWETFMPKHLIVLSITFKKSNQIPILWRFGVVKKVVGTILDLSNS